MQTAQEAAPVAAKAEKKKKVKAPRARPKGLPSEFEIAGALNRTIGAWTNVVVNFGLIAVAVAQRGLLSEGGR